MRKLIEKFLDHVRYENGCSDNTRVAYASDLEAFAIFLARRGVKSWTEVEVGTVRDFLEAERVAGRKATTRERRRVAVKMFFDFLVDIGSAEKNPSETIESIRRDRRLPRVLDEKTMLRLLDSINGDSRYALRDRALLELMYACGLRVSEVAALELADINFEERLLRCRGKGGKVRTVPVGREALERLKIYLTESRPLLAKNCAANRGEAFLTRLGEPFTRQGIAQMLLKRAQEAEIEQKLSPHVIRHTFATSLLSHGAQIRAIQEMLGHADISTTQIYTHVDNRRLLELHRNFFKRDE